MAIKERDVVLMGKDGADGTIDLPVTRLGNIEDGAEVKTTLADADALPVVDSADAQEMKKITWTNVVAAIKGKLNGVYAAVSHSHAWSAITGKPTSMTPTAHKNSHRTGGSDALTAADIGALPKSGGTIDGEITVEVIDGVGRITFGNNVYILSGPEALELGVAGEAQAVLLRGVDTPVTSTDAANKEYVDGVVAAKADDTHTHGAGDITSGTLNSARLPTVPLTKGGTGGTTAAAARANLGALGAFSPVNITISATWSGSGPWTQRVAVSGVKAAWDWRLGLHLAKITDDASRKLQEKAMMCITWCETYDGGITLTCRDKKPDVAIQAVLSGEV